MENKNNQLKDYNQNYELLNEIGKGCFGKVYKAKVKGKDEFRAIKIIDKNKIKAQLRKEYEKQNIEEEYAFYYKDFRNEIYYMKICQNNNNNSVRFYEYYDNEDEFIIVIELCDENLLDLIIRTKKTFTLRDIYNLLSQLNNTFKIMHENKIVHRDLKLENILIKYEDKEKIKFTYKLTDYGLSRRFLRFSQRFSTQMVGTIDMMAPEILSKEEYGYECDLWSLGIIIYILFFGKHPYDADTSFAILNKINIFKQKLFKKSGEKYFDNLIRELLVSEPKNRLTWVKYFNHPFFTKKQIFNKNEIANYSISYKSTVGSQNMNKIYYIKDEDDELPYSHKRSYRSPEELYKFIKKKKMERKEKKETDKRQNYMKLFNKYKNLVNLNYQRTNYHNLNKKQQKKNKEKDKDKNKEIPYSTELSNSIKSTKTSIKIKSNISRFKKIEEVNDFYNVQLNKESRTFKTNNININDLNNNLNSENKPKNNNNIKINNKDNYKDNKKIINNKRGKEKLLINPKAVENFVEIFKSVLHRKIFIIFYQSYINYENYQRYKTFKQVIRQIILPFIRKSYRNFLNNMYFKRKLEFLILFLTKFFKYKIIETIFIYSQIVGVKEEEEAERFELVILKIMKTLCKPHLLKAFESLKKYKRIIKKDNNNNKPNNDAKKEDKRKKKLKIRLKSLPKFSHMKPVKKKDNE